MHYEPDGASHHVHVAPLFISDSLSVHLTTLYNIYIFTLYIIEK